MSDKDLQRVTKCVSDIGQASARRRSLPARRNHITQKVKIAGQRTLYLSVHDDAQPAEVFLRVKGPDCSSELIGLYDVIARLMSLALQYGAPLEKVGDLLAGAQFAPCGPVVGHDRLKHCSSLPDLIGRHLLVEYCGRHELGHVPVAAHTDGSP
jgi:ribonucleoside-diphosphate reductase alpha chain